MACLLVLLVLATFWGCGRIGFDQVGPGSDDAGGNGVDASDPVPLDACTPDAAGPLGCDARCPGECGDGGCGLTDSPAPDEDACDALPNVQSTMCGPTGDCIIQRCAPGFGDCDADVDNGCETSLGRSDRCSRCGDACSSGETCDAFECVPCAAGRADCNRDASDGCEARLDSLNDCGGCGVQCDKASCGGGMCTAVVCAEPLADCNLDEASCETDLTGDVRHCGACGATCSFESATPNATLACVAGACTAVCATGYADCDGDYRTGCETAVNTPSQCGGCGFDCNAELQHTAATSCHPTTFTCEIEACEAPRADCDGDHATGCEADLTSVRDCGGCATTGANDPCEGLANVQTSSCMGGACQINVCAAGFLDCDRQTATGCEREIALDGPCEKTLVIDSSLVDVTLDSFPLLVRFTDSDIQALARGDGHDIFFTDLAGAELAFEREAWDAGSGSLMAWVRVPTVSASADTEFLVRYGDGVDMDRQNTGGVWDAEFEAVYHLADLTDSSGYGRHCTNVGSVSYQAGYLGAARDFRGNDELNCGDDVLPHEDDYTISAWGRVDYDSGDDTKWLVASTAADPPFPGFALGIDNPNGSPVTWNSGWQRFDTLGVPDLAWFHIAARVHAASSGGYVEYRINGGAFVRQTYGNTEQQRMTSASSLYIGGESSTSPPENWLGQIDEVHISSTSRSDAWLKVEYENQRNGSTLVTLR